MKAIKRIAEIALLTLGVVIMLVFIGGMISIPLYLLAINCVAPKQLNAVQTMISIGGLLVMWSYALIHGINSASYIYGFKVPMMIGRVGRREVLIRESTLRSPMGVILSTAFSYFLTIYAYALVYAYISNLYGGQFTKENLTFVDAAYFSVITAATVGYGDIAPKSDLARMLVITEVGVNMVYVIFLFSFIATLARPRAARREDT